VKEQERTIRFVPVPGREIGGKETEKKALLCHRFWRKTKVETAPPRSLPRPEEVSKDDEVGQRKS